MTVHVTINGQEFTGEPQAGEVGSLRKLRVHGDYKAVREAKEREAQESSTYLASDLVCDEEGNVIDVTVTEVPRAQIKGVIPGFARKHAASVNKAKDLGRRK